MVRNNPLHQRFTNVHQQAFLQYLGDFSFVNNEQELFLQLANCHDALPYDAARDLGLLPGATYADAVKLLSHRWQLS
jgi:hypothetical protein